LKLFLAPGAPVAALPAIPHEQTPSNSTFDDIALDKQKKQDN
jgi:hypothetical protein